ncbi:uncharacterized protein PRCAT00005840001 [Priceomyces carsonii]|uniref:uncharacterized protein n=1 Tax=Priceomyces carsonii TaxID=28549 RepID=UPI002ED7FCFE|nr:unnamed protein product [Priceomyces carsonii]
MMRSQNCRQVLQVDSTVRSEIIELSETDSINVSQEENFPDGGTRGCFVVLGSFFGLIVMLGLINSVGVIQAYVSSHQLVDLDSSAVSWVFSVYLSLAYAFGIIVGPIFDKYGTFMLLTVSALLVFGGLMASANSNTIWQFILSYIVLGVGNGIGLTPLVGVINHWFLKKRGLATGLATCGGSVGGLIYPLMLRKLYIQVGYTWAIRILAFFCLGCMTISTFMVKERIKREPTTSLTEEQNSKWKVVGKKAYRFSIAKFKDKKYSTLSLGALFCEISLVLSATYFPNYAMAQGQSISTSYLMLTVWNSAGILGRGVPSLLSDFWGRFNVNILMLLGYNACIFVLWLPLGSRLDVLLAYAALGGFFLASILTMVPACLAQITPVDQFGEKYGLMFAILSLGNFAGLPIGASIINQGSIRNYDMFVVFIGCLSLVGTMFWVICRILITGFKLRIKV